MNPYEPPKMVYCPQAKVDRVAYRKQNPAKTYLIACALLCIFGLSVTFPLGPSRLLFAQTISFTAFSLYAATSLSLAFRRFGKTDRIFTIVWALLAAAGILFVITYVDPADPSDPRNFPGMVIFGGCFALLGYIVWLCSVASPEVSTTEPSNLLNK